MANLTPKHEGITGASLSGTDGTANRTYTLTNDNYSSMIEILIQGSPQHESTDFTVNGQIITFVNVIYNDMPISIRYFVTDADTLVTGGMGYCSTGDVYRTAGITSTEISTADVTQQILEAEAFVCRHTKNIYYKTNLDNQTATDAANTTITVSGAGWTANDYANQYVYIISGTGSGQYRKITSNTTDTITVDRAWTTNPAAASTFRIFYVPSDFNPYVDATDSEAYDGNGLKYFYLPKYPLNALESLVVANTTVTTTAVYQWRATGKLQMKNTAEKSLFSSAYPQEIEVKYWYGITSLPYDVKRVVELRAAIQILGQQMGGTFDDPSTVTLPEATISVGQAYINIRSSLETLKEEYNELLKTIKVYPVFSY